MYTVAVEPRLESLLDNNKLDTLAKQGILALSVPYTFYNLKDKIILERAKALNERGIRIITSHLPFGSHNALHSHCSDYDEQRKSTIAMWTHYLRRFALAGMHSTPLHTGGCMHPRVPQPIRDRLTDTLEKLLPVAQSCGIIIALENTFYENPPMFEEMGDELTEPFRYVNDDCALLAEYVGKWGSEYIKVCFDMGHANLFGHQVLNDLRILLPHTALLHVHDNNGIDDLHYRPGLGTIPWNDVAAYLKQADYKGEIFSEVGWDPDPEMARKLQELEELTKTMRETLKHLTNG